MAGALVAGKIDAAVLPEPFASAGEELDGIVPIADLDQGAANQFMTVGYATAKAWATAHPKTLAAFYRALQKGQQIADTDRAAVEEAMVGLPAPFGVSKADSEPHGGSLFPGRGGTGWLRGRRPAAKRSGPHAAVSRVPVVQRQVDADGRLTSRTALDSRS
jgi:hypothetical protein